MRGVVWIARAASGEDQIAIVAAVLSIGHDVVAGPGNAVGIESRELHIDTVHGYALAVHRLAVGEFRLPDENGQRTVAAVEAGTVVIEDDVARRCGLILRHDRAGIVGGDRQFVHAVDGDRQKSGVYVAVGIGHLIGDDVRHRAARTEPKHGRVGDVDRVAIAAIRLDDDLAIGCRHDRALRTLHAAHTRHDQRSIIAGICVAEKDIARGRRGVVGLHGTDVVIRDRHEVQTHRADARRTRHAAFRDADVDDAVAFCRGARDVAVIELLEEGLDVDVGRRRAADACDDQSIAVACHIQGHTSANADRGGLRAGVQEEGRVAVRAEVVKQLSAHVAYAGHVQRHAVHQARGVADHNVAADDREDGRCRGLEALRVVRAVGRTVEIHRRTLAIVHHQRVGLRLQSQIASDYGFALAQSQLAGFAYVGDGEDRRFGRRNRVRAWLDLGNGKDVRFAQRAHNRARLLVERLVDRHDFGFALRCEGERDEPTRLAARALPAHEGARIGGERILGEVGPVHGFRTRQHGGGVEQKARLQRFQAERRFQGGLRGRQFGVLLFHRVGFPGRPARGARRAKGIGRADPGWDECGRIRPAILPIRLGCVGRARPDGKYGVMDA